MLIRPTESSKLKGLKAWCHPLLVKRGTGWCEFAGSREALPVVGRASIGARRTAQWGFKVSEPINYRDHVLISHRKDAKRLMTKSIWKTHRLFSEIVWLGDPSSVRGSELDRALTSSSRGRRRTHRSSRNSLISSVSISASMPLNPLLLARSKGVHPRNWKYYNERMSKQEGKVYRHMEEGFAVQLYGSNRYDIIKIPPRPFSVQKNA